MRSGRGAAAGIVPAAALAVGLFQPSAARGAEPLLLRAAAAEALGKNPGLLGAAAEVEIAEAARHEAVSSFFPRVVASGGVTHGDDPVYVFGSLLRQGRLAQRHFDPAFLNDPEPLRNWRLGLDATWRVFDGFRRLAGSARAGEDVLRAASTLSEAQQRTLAATVAAYWGAVVAERRREVAASSVRAAEAEAGALRDRFDQELVVRSDLLSAEVRLAELRAQLLEADGSAVTAREALGAVLGRPGAELPPLAAELPHRELPPGTLEEAIATGLLARGELAAAEAARRGAELGVRAAEGDLLPKVDAFASWEWNAERTGDDWGRDRTVGAVLTIPLLEPGRLSRVRAARAAATAAKARADGARDRVRYEIVSAWNRASAARERVAVAGKAAEQAAEADAILADRYREGLTTIGERLRGEAALLGARLALLSARHDAVVFGAELLRATGGLKNVDDVD